MKRVGGIFSDVLRRENLQLAFWKASRGKHSRGDQRAYAQNLEENMFDLRSGLADGTYPVGRYRRFKIHDPKEREICAAAFGERVLHHAIMNICEPYFDRWLVGKTYACRKGYGQFKAVAEAQRNARQFGWYLKCDIRKFFDSVSHANLRALISLKFKDPDIVAWFSRLLDTYETTVGHGLPIGNLTSQHLANLYLDRLDRFVLETCQQDYPRLGYVRYMDDFVVWSNDKTALLGIRGRMRSFLSDELELQFKQEPVVQLTSRGMDFLGQRVYPCRVRAARASLRRYLRKRRHYERLEANGVWSESVLQERVTALTAFLEQSDTLNWRRHHLEDLGNRRNTSGNNRDLRGGSWNNNANNCRSANRNNNNPSNENNNNGFRLCCSAAPFTRRMVPADFLSLQLQGEQTCLTDAGSRGEGFGSGAFLV